MVDGGRRSLARIHFGEVEIEMATASVALRLGPADHGRPLTLEEYLDAELEEGSRYELARGVLEVSNVPKFSHWQVVSNLFDAISRYKFAHPGFVRVHGGGSECQLLIPTLNSGRNPDLAVVLTNAPKDARGRYMVDLAAEVVSEGTEAEDRDYRVKREEYLVYGLREYWVVDRFRNQLTLLVRDGGAWTERILRGEQVIASHVLPGFAATVGSLWEGVEDDSETANETQGEE